MTKLCDGYYNEIIRSVKNNKTRRCWCTVYNNNNKYDNNVLINTD